MLEVLLGSCTGWPFSEDSEDAVWVSPGLSLAISAYKFYRLLPIHS